MKEQLKYPVIVMLLLAMSGCGKEKHGKDHPDPKKEEKVFVHPGVTIMSQKVCPDR